MEGKGRRIYGGFQNLIETKSNLVSAETRLIISCRNILHGNPISYV